MINFHTFVVFLTSGYILLSTPLGIYMYAIAFLSITLMLGELVITKKRVNNFLFVFLMVFIAVILISGLVNHNINNINSSIKMIVILTFSFLYCSIYSVESSVRAFLNIMYVLALTSLILYFSVNVLNISIPSIQVLNSNNIAYNYLVIYSYFDGFMQFRNNSVFWEPGIYASFIIFSLYLEMYFYDSKRLCRVFILCISLITTLSSAGFVLFSLYLLSTIIRFKVSLKFIFLFVVAFLLLIGLLDVMLDIINSNGVDPMRSINKLLNPMETETHRIESPLNLFHLFSSNPLIGLGLDGAMYKYSKLSEISLTSTSLFYFASFGIVSFIFLLPIFAFLLINRARLLEGLILVVVYLVIINKELHLYFISNYLIMFYVLFSLITKKLFPNE